MTQVNSRIQEFKNSRIQEFKKNQQFRAEVRIAHKSLKISVRCRLSVSNRQRLGRQGERPQSLNFDSVASADGCDRHYSAIENGLGSLVA